MESPFTGALRGQKGHLVVTAKFSFRRATKEKNKTLLVNEVNGIGCNEDKVKRSNR